MKYTRKIFWGVLLSFVVIVIVLCVCLGGSLVRNGVIDDFYAFVESNLDSWANQYIAEQNQNLYGDQFDWTEVLDRWGNEKIAVGTLETYWEQVKDLEIDCERMTVYSKEKMQLYLDDVQPEVSYFKSETDQDGYETMRPIYVLKFALLQDFHAMFPIECIVLDRESNDGDEKRIRVIYKVQDEFGYIQYCHVFFNYRYNPTGMLNDTEYEAWIFDHDSYYYTDTFSIE